MNVYLCDFMTEDMHAPCLIIAWIFFIKITHTAKRSRPVDFLTMNKKLYTNGLEKFVQIQSFSQPLQEHGRRGSSLVI